MKTTKSKAKPAAEEAPAPTSNGMWDRAALVARVKDKRGNVKEQVIQVNDIKPGDEPVLSIQLDLSKPSSIRLPLPDGAVLFLYTREADPVEDEAKDVVTKETEG